MSYEYITKYNSPNYTSGRQGNGIKEIVIHHWGVDGQSFDGVVNWLCRSNGTSSAHYVVQANKVACLVDCANTAWHAGNWAHNLKSIGIECRPEMSSGDLETVCELVADIYKCYGVLPIIGHKDVASTACPGRYYAKLAYIKQRAQEIMNGKQGVTSATNTPDQILTVGSKVRSIGLIAERIDIKKDMVYNSVVGGWIPCADVDEVDARDGKKDQILHVGSGFAFPKEMTVTKVSAKTNTVYLKELGYWVNANALTEVKEGS